MGKTRLEIIPYNLIFVCLCKLHFFSRVISWDRINYWPTFITFFQLTFKMKIIFNWILIFHFQDFKYIWRISIYVRYNSGQNTNIDKVLCYTTSSLEFSYYLLKKYSLTYYIWLPLYQTYKYLSNKNCVPDMIWHNIRWVHNIT